MKLILAVEPEVARAEVLRQTVPDRLGVELVIVGSAAAAIVAINRQVPDVLLIGQAISPADQEVIAGHTKSMGAAPNLLTIPIPDLQVSTPEPRRSRFGLRKSSPAPAPGWNPYLFVEQIGRSIREDDAQRGREAEQAAIEPAIAGVSGHEDSVASEATQPRLLAGDVAEGPLPNVESPVAAEATIDGVSDARVGPSDPARTEDAPGAVASGPDVLASVVEQVKEAGATRWTEAIDRLRAESALERAAYLEALERDAAALRDAVERDARAVAEASAREALSAALEHMRLEAQEACSAGLAAARADAEARLVSTLSQVRAEAEQAVGHAAAESLRAEVERTREEAAARLDAEIDRIRRDAERARLDQDRARQDGVAMLERAARDAHAAGEEAARQIQEEIAGLRAQSQAQIDAAMARFREDAEQAWSARLAEVRTNTEARLTCEFARVRDDIERALEDRTAATLRAGVERAHAEALERVDQELLKLRDEATRVRLEQEQAMQQVGSILDRVAREAHAAAEQAATRQLQEKVARALKAAVAAAKTDADARLETMLAMLGRRAEQAQVDHQQHQREMEHIREQALKDARSLSDALAMELTRARERAAGHGLSTPEPASTRDQAVRRWGRHRRLVLAFGTAAVLVVVVGSLSVPPVVNTAALQLIDRVRLLGAAAPAEPPRSPDPPTPPQPTAPRRAAQRPPRPRPAAAPGFLAVSAGIPLDLYAGTERIGASSDGQLSFAAGSHTITVVSDRFNFRAEFPLEIRPGESTTHAVPLPAAPVHVETEPGAEVWIDDRLVGQAPLGAADVPIGTHEVVVRHPQLGERRQSIDVRFGDTTTLTLDFGNAEPPQP